MPVTRRDVLWSLGGGLAGAALTPVPWKLLDDVSIHTQRRWVLPAPARGPVTFHPTACTLCPAGCRLRVRCVGAQPVSVVGSAAQPLAGGFCALGLTLHHLAVHPLRIARPTVRVAGRHEPVPLSRAIGQIAEAVTRAGAAGQRTLVLDRRPGRVVSSAWRQLVAALPGGAYATRAGEGRTFDVLQAALTRPALLGLDLERTRTLVSVGAPVLEGWGRPARMRAARPGLNVVQVDTWRSPSAALADEWVAIEPGGEGPLALALAHTVARERGASVPEDLRRTLEAFSPRDATPRTGLAPDRVEALGRRLVRQSPAVAIGGGDPGAGPLSLDAERAIALLNVALGAPGCEGGFVARRPVPDAAETSLAATVDLADVPPGSVGVLLLDAADDGRALPWATLRSVLAPGATVVSLCPFEGAITREADIVVPAPTPLEAWDEVLPTADARAACYALSAPVLEPPAEVTDGIAVVQSLAGALRVDVGQATHEERLRERVAAIHATGRGRLVPPSEGVGDAEASRSARDLWEGLAGGGCWMDDALPPSTLVVALTPPEASTLERWRRRDAAGGLSLVTFASRGTVGTTPLSPLLTKLYQESDLRAGATVAATSEETARRLGLVAGRTVRVVTTAGAVGASLRIDPTLPPDRIALAAGPDPSVLHPGVRIRAAGALPVVVASPDGTWRETRVRLQEA
jgi:anaerobic selenocysteine-containing dehydrogenase